uniref:Uncharacterized protein n=1 Tax=Arundo donax TaxID=35708 RepID=A0A0A9GUQ9_ARUDO
MAHPTGEGSATRLSPYRKAGAACCWHCRRSTRRLRPSSSSCSTDRSLAAAATAALLLQLLRGQFLPRGMGSCASRGEGVCTRAAGGGE